MEFKHSLASEQNTNKHCQDRTLQHQRKQIPMKTKNLNLKTPLLGGAIVALCLCALPTTAQERGTQASLEEATALAAMLIEHQQSPLESALTRVSEARIASESAPANLSGVTSSQSEAATSRYANSIQQLAGMPVPRTLGALAAAMTHPHASVRLASVVALREGASSRDPHSTALMRARDLILADPSPAVRRQAFEAYCRWGDQTDVLGLAKQLGRAAGPVQDLAVREWLRIEQEFAVGARQ